MAGLGPNWDTFRDTVRDAHTDWFDLPDVQVHNFSGGYDPATGETDGWDDDGGTPVPAEIVVPDNPDIVTDAQGQEAEVERRVYIRDDAGVAIHPVGTENHRPTEIAHDDRRYIVAEALDEDTGLVKLLCVEA